MSMVTRTSLAAAAAALTLVMGSAQAQTLNLGKQGLELRAADGRVSDQLKLRIKRWDQRSDAQGRALALVQDADSGRLLLLRAEPDGSKLQQLARWPGPAFAAEQLCLHRDAQGLLQLFLLGEDGMSEQWLLDESGRSAPRQLRRLATPHAPLACRVRDAEAALYIAEAGVGLWRYAADAEREGRSLLLADAKSDEKALLQRLDEWLTAHPVVAPTAPAPVIVLPSAQTQPVRAQGDAADDPAIWVHPRQGSRSLVLGTDKKLGLAVYDLQGRERQFLPVGRVNNVDLRQGLRYGHERLDLAVATQRDEHALVLFGISPQDGRVRELARLPTGLDDIYGICVGRNAEGGLDAFPNDKDGRVRQLRLQREPGKKGGWSATLVREFRLPSQPEGCVVDEARQQLFVGEEKRGVWRVALGAGQASAEPVLAIPVSAALHADVEGMAIHDSPKGRFLVVSSQGNDSYVVYDADAPHALRGTFRIGINAALGIDGASETDGLDVTSANLGGSYREGLLVVQDGRKRLPQGTQNFKLVPWSAVKGKLGL
ncbi:MAG: 3-phytase [Methylibium sp.]|nr:3-phytase [Methylibium sp.]